jgi:taurine dioxygenase
MSIPINVMFPFGVEVAVDLREPTHDDDIKKLFEEHGFLLFRDQDLTLEQQKRLLSRLGPVLDDWSTVGYVSNTRKDGILGESDVSFHSDFIYTSKPLLGLSLHAIDVQYEKTWTRFASGVRALEALPEDLRARIADLEGLNLFSATKEGLLGRQRLEGYPENAPRMAHRVINVDPITQKPVLYVTEMNTAALIGLKEEESEDILAKLRGYLYAPENIYEHRWRNGDMLIWSNRAYHHARGGLTRGVPRTLQRVCLTEATADMYRPPIPADRLPPNIRADY